MFRQLRKWFIWNFILFFLTAEVTYSLTGEEAVKRFFEYFRADDPVGIPVVKFEEPMELYSPLELYPVTLINGRLLGHSQMKFQQVFIDFLSLTGTAKVHCPRIEIFGNYRWPSIFYTSEGFMNATIEEVTARSNFTMMLDLEDSIKVTNIQFYQESEEVYLNLTHLIWEHKMIVSSGAVHLFFDEIATQIFEQLRPFLMSEVNREVSKFTSSLPASKFLFSLTEEKRGDETLEEKLQRRTALLLNKLLQYLDVDPLNLPDLSKTVLGVQFTVTELTMFGISSVSQLKTMLIILQQNKIYVECAMKYPHLILFYKVEMDSGILGKLDLSQTKQLNNVDLHIRLTLDPGLKRPPTINYFDIDVESFGKIRSGRKSFWGKLSNAYDKVEDSITSSVVDALQGTLRKILQKQLNTLDIQNGLLSLVKKN